MCALAVPCLPVAVLSEFASASLVMLSLITVLRGDGIVAPNIVDLVNGDY